jgi:hypothetical protein
LKPCQPSSNQNFQIAIIDFLRLAVLPPDAFKAVYTQTLIFEVAKFVSFLRQSTQFFIESEDPKLAKMDIMT